VAHKSYLTSTSPRPNYLQIRFLCPNPSPRQSRHQTLSPQGHRYSRITRWNLQGRPCKRKWPRPGVVLSVNEGSVQATAPAMNSPVRSTTLSHILSAYHVSRFQWYLTPLSHPNGSTDTPILLFRIQSGHDMYLRGVPPDLLHRQRTRRRACSLYRLQIRLCSRPCKIRSGSSWPMRPSTSPCIRQSRRKRHLLWRTRRMSETEQSRKFVGGRGTVCTYQHDTGH